MPSFHGRCHCGALELTFTSDKPAHELPLRACACSFCRRHGMRSVADPQGRVVFKANDPAALHKYRFGLQTASFLICRNCGTYIGSVYSGPAGDTAVVNVNCFDDQRPFTRAAESVDYAAETAEQRRQRRQRVWTPAAWA